MVVFNMLHDHIIAAAVHMAVPDAQSWTDTVT